MAAATIAGLLMLVLRGVGWSVAWRRGVHLRMPTSAELDDITEPIGRIAVRYLPMDALGPDLVDLGMAAKAVTDYVAGEDPLLYRVQEQTHGIEEMQ